MTRIRYRWLLPIGHLLIDTLVLVLCLWHSQTVLHRSRSYSLGKSGLTKAVMLQEAGAPGWDFRNAPVPEEYAFLRVGNLPALIVSSIARPKAFNQIRSTLWDPWWFLIHELVSFAVWFGLGRAADFTGQRPRTMLWQFLALRGALAPFVTLPIIARLGVLLEGIFWLGVVIYLVARIFRWCYRVLAHLRHQIDTSVKP
jgi:hypothetical protein